MTWCCDDTDFFQITILERSCKMMHLCTQGISYLQKCGEKQKTTKHTSHIIIVVALAQNYRSPNLWLEILNMTIFFFGRRILSETAIYLQHPKAIRDQRSSFSVPRLRLVACDWHLGCRFYGAIVFQTLVAEPRPEIMVISIFFTKMDLRL